MKFKVSLAYTNQDRENPIAEYDNKYDLLKELSNKKFAKLGGIYYNMDLVKSFSVEEYVESDIKVGDRGGLR